MKNMKIKHLNAKSEQFIDKWYVTATNVHNQVTDKHKYQFRTIGQHNKPDKYKYRILDSMIGIEIVLETIGSLLQY